MDTDRFSDFIDVLHEIRFDSFMFEYVVKTSSAMRLPAVLVLAVLLAAPASQGEMIDLGYEFRMAANLGVLKNPDDPVTNMLAAWQTQHDLQIARNMPFAELVNTSEMDSTQLTMFSMTVGDMDHQFDWVRVVDASPGVSATVQLVDTVESGLAGDAFQLEFENFHRGDFVRFQFDLDPDSADAFPLSDFRTVLFDANGNDTADNATLEAVFHDEQASEHVTLEGQLSDFSVEGPLFVGPAFHSYSTMDHVTVFPAARSGQVELAASVPEPSVWVLLAFALCLMPWMQFRHGCGVRVDQRLDATFGERE